MAVNYLHIWPRQTFMLIALPNQVIKIVLFVTKSCNLLFCKEDYKIAMIYGFFSHVVVI